MEESAHKVNSGEENSPAAPAGNQTNNRLIMSLELLPTSYPGWITDHCTDKLGFSHTPNRPPSFPTVQNIQYRPLFGSLSVALSVLYPQYRASPHLELFLGSSAAKPVPDSYTGLSLSHTQRCHHTNSKKLTASRHPHPVTYCTLSF